MITEFNKELAMELYEAKEEFPINFEDAWQWLGYNQKSDALSTLKSNFSESEDWCSFKAEGLKLKRPGRPSDNYFLTIDCFKMLGMIAGTKQGKLIRQYFLECEREAKKHKDLINNDPILKLRLDQMRQEEVLKDHTMRLVAIEERSQEAERSLKQMPPSNVDVPERSVSANINTIIRDYALSNNLDIIKVWVNVYREFRDRYHIDLTKRGKNHKPKLTGVQMADNLGMSDELYAVANTICSTSSQN